MNMQLQITHLLFALAGAFVFGSLAGASSVEAGHRYGYDGYHDVVVHRRVVRRPAVRRVVVVERPIIYRPRPVVRTVVVEQPYYSQAHYGYGWRQRVVYPRPHRWHDRPRCWLPERHLCR